MKIRLAIIAAAFAALLCRGDEEIKMVEQQSTTVSVAFPIRSYTPSNKEVVRIEKTGDTSLRITALRRGRCDIDVIGDMELTQKFQISVGHDLDRKCANLSRELEAVPEVLAEVSGDYIKITGTVTKIKDWTYMMKVLKLYPEAHNFAVFTPGDDLLAKMKENIQQCGLEAGFTKFTGKPESWKANYVALDYNTVNRTMNIQAKVYTPEQLEQIRACALRESAWLASDGAKAAEGNSAVDPEHQSRLNFQVYVARPTIRLSIAYMALGESDIAQIGNPSAVTEDGAFQITGIFNILQNLLHGGGTGKQAQIGANLGFTTRFLAENGISRVSDMAYTLMESWGKDGATFKSGGTIFVRVYGGEAADLKEIPYGFTIGAKGGMLDESRMELDLDFGLSSVVPMTGDTYDRKEDISKQKITCPIGRTTCLSGFSDLVDRRTPPSGIPVLRNTPLLNWFVADRKSEVTDRKLIVMVCPEIVDTTIDGTLGVENEINIPLKAVEGKTTKQILDEREEEEGFTGFWSWLNWFTF